MRIELFNYSLGLSAMIFGFFTILVTDSPLKMSLAGFVLLMGWNLVQRHKLNDLVERVNEE